MQRGVADGDAAYVDGLQIRHGRQRAGAPHLRADVIDPRRRLARRIFVRHGPARRFGRSAQFRPKPRVIHLDHDAINFVVQAVALVFPFLDVSQKIVERGASLPIRINLETHFGEGFENLRSARP